MGVGSLVLDALAPCSGGLLYLPALALGAYVVIRVKPALQVVSGNEKTLVLIAFYAGILGVALAAWIPFAAFALWWTQTRLAGGILS